MKRKLWYALATISLSMMLGCSSKQPQSVKFFKDYSLIEGKGINEFDVRNKMSGPYVEVLFPDSSYQEISLKNSDQDFVKGVIFKREKSSLNYQIVHHSKHMGALFFSFKDSILKLYSFGTQLGSEVGPIESSLTIADSQRLTSYRFLVKSTDTINFIQKISDFDTLTSIQRIDSSQTNERLKLYNLTSMVKWLSGR